MRIIAKSTLIAFYTKHSDAKQTLLAWYAHTSKSAWRSPGAVKSDFSTASILQDGRVVFNIGGNKYRLVAWINFDFQVVYIRFVGTHTQYDKINAQVI